MDRLWTVLVLVAVGAVGWLSLRRQVVRLIAATTFAGEYLAVLQRYLRSDGADGDALSYLLHHAQHMQNNLGPMGYVGLRPAGSDVMISSCSVVPTVLSEMRRYFATDVLSSFRIPQEYGAQLQEILLRHLGARQRELTETERLTRNPLACLREGVVTMLSIPLLLLVSVGILGDRSAATVQRNSFVRLVAGIVTLIGLVGSIFTIVLGWNDMEARLRTLMESRESRPPVTDRTYSHPL